MSAGDVSSRAVADALRLPLLASDARCRGIARLLWCVAAWALMSCNSFNELSHSNRACVVGDIVPERRKPVKQSEQCGLQMADRG